MSELFQLKPCEECNGTGDAHSQGHDYDCPDCLGTGYEDPAKRIMNLELMLNQHKEILKSSDAHNNELAQQLEIAREQRDRLAELAETQADYKCLAELLDGHDATECRMNLVRLKEQRDRLAEALREWAEVREWLEMSDFVKGYMKARQDFFDGLDKALQSLTQPKKYDANEHQSFYP
jgi:chromosome segregation ATPase